MMTAWKCYRCNLEFKEKLHAEMHHQITKHSTDERGIEYSKEALMQFILRKG